MTPGRTLLGAVAGLSLAAAPCLAQAPLSARGNAAAAAPSKGDGAAGVTWTTPGSWSKGKGSAMRVATYVVPGAGEGADGECAVFYFGPNQGGGIDANVQRWERQFKEQPKAKRSRKTVSGVGVHLVDISGTYLNPGGGMMQSRGESPDYRLLGAIVEAPQGNVFFKFTGPEATVKANQGAFDALVGSLRK